MQFIHTNLGQRKRGEIIQVTLTNTANVRLMDSSNFSNYKHRRHHKYFGGLAKRSPLRLQIPSSGHWHITVDMQGLRGSTKASVTVLPGALPEIQERPLNEVPGLIRDNIPPTTESGGEIYDVSLLSQENFVTLS